MIIVSLTTIPSRLEKGLTTKSIQSILEQTSKPDLIILNIPEVSRKGDPYNKRMAEYVASLDESIKLHWVPEDYGPITKLMGTLEYIEENTIDRNSKIILIDDDCIYNKDMIAILLREQSQTNTDAIGFASRDIILKDKEITTVYHHTSEKHTTPFHQSTSFLETFAGVVYNAALFFPLEQFKQWCKSLPFKITLNDDIVINAWIQSKGFTPIVIRINQDMTKHDAEGTEELRSLNLENGNIIDSIRYFIDQGYFKSTPVATEGFRNKENSDVFSIRFAIICVGVFLLLRILR